MACNLQGVMKANILALLLVAGGAIGLAMPSASVQNLADAPAVPQAPKAAALTSAGSPQWASHAALQRSHDGHFYAEVFINGSPTRMLVDTGASVIALTGTDAETMGIHWDYSALSVVAQGASGPVEGVRVRLPEVEMDGFVARDVAAIVVPEGLGVSLLGQSFLSTIGKVEIADEQMVLSN